MAHRGSRGLESTSHSIHLGRQTPCPSRSGLRSAAPPGRIRGNDDLRCASPYPLGSLLQEGGLMLQHLTTDPLVFLTKRFLEMEKKPFAQHETHKKFGHCQPRKVLRENAPFV